jgi:hypothetical protein
VVIQKETLKRLRNYSQTNTTPMRARSFSPTNWRDVVVEDVGLRICFNEALPSMWRGGRNMERKEKEKEKTHPVVLKVILHALANSTQ